MLVMNTQVLSRLIRSVLCLTALAPILRAAEPSAPTAHYVGMNVWFCNDWDGSNAFADIMMHARNWQKRIWNDGSASIDAEGWPTEDASTVIFGKDNQLGTYKLFVEGQVGNINLMWTPGSVTNIQYHAATNTTTADVTITNNNTGGLTLYNTRRTPSSPLNSGFRNLRLYRPGHATDGSELYDQRFIALMQPFQVIRFMDWVDTNKNGEVSWSNRRRPGMATRPEYAYEGQTGLSYAIPYEYMIALCNQLNADMWLNIPTWADDDYVTKLAQALKYGTDGTNPYTSPQTNLVWPPLNPNLKVYVEYANEVWNSAAGFRCFPWILGIADAIAADPAPHPIKLKLDSTGNPTGTYDEIDRWTLQARYTAYRSVQISDLFRTVWGDAAMNTRIRVALMGQIGGNYFNPRQLPWLDAFYNRNRPGSDPFPNPNPRPVVHYLYAAGGSAYYGVNTWSTDPDIFFAPSNYPETDWLAALRADAIRAKNYGLKRVAYEGGQGLDIFNRPGQPSATDAQKLALNGDPRMKTMVETYHDAWTALGGELLTYYVNTSARDWEFTPSINTLNTPKLNAARGIINDRQRVAVTLGQEIPGILNARQQKDTVFADISGGTFNANSSTGEPVMGGFDAGESVGFAVNTRYRGLYRLRVQAGTNGTVPLQIHINGNPVGTVTLTGTNQAVMVHSTPLDCTIPDEFNVVRVTVQSGSVHLQGIEFEYIDPSVPRITSSSLPLAAQGHPYLATLSGTGGTPPYTWSISSGTLPVGLSLNASTGAISGIPSATGSTNLSFTLTDSSAPPLTFTRSLSLQVNPAPQITSPAAFAVAQVGQSYSATLTASGGAPPYTWSISSGALPAGMSLDSSTGAITGVPTTVGFAVFTIILSDGASPAVSESRTYVLDVAPPVPPPSGDPAILHFAFDEASGSTLLDTADAGYDHTANASVSRVTDGKYGGAVSGLSFTGITPTNQSDLQFEPGTHAFTFSAWVRVPVGIPAGYYTLLDRSASGSSGFRIWTTNNWNSVQFISGGTGATLHLPSGVSLADGNWHLLTFVNYNDGGTWRFRGYHNDGATSVQGNTGSNSPGTALLRIGALSGNYNSWKGAIDDVRIYPRALAPEEIPLLYSGILPVNGTPIFSTWINAYSSLPAEMRTPLADPDGDGLSNLMEYALGASPVASSTEVLPVIDVLEVGGISRLRFSFTLAHTYGLRYFIEASTNLSTWTEQTEITDKITFGQPYIHIDPVRLDSATSRRFLHLRVETAP